MQEPVYPMRAHHGMCICFFQGKGYNEAFTQHMSEMIHLLNQNPLICLSDNTDLICTCCPNNQQGICITAEQVTKYDQQVLSLCALTVGTIIPFAEFQKNVYEKILYVGKREEICGDCQWNAICQLPKSHSKE